MNSTVILEVGGNVYSGWKSVSLTFDMAIITNSFSVTAHDPDNILGQLEVGTLCKLSSVNGSTKSLLLDGVIVAVDQELSDTSDVTIKGFDKLIDLVDCSIMRASRTWVKKKFSGIIKDIADPFGVVVDTTDLRDDPVIEKLTVQTGEPAFDAIERLCRSQAVLPMSTFEGVLKLGYTGTAQMPERLEIGNIKSLKKSTNWSERFSEYTAMSQSGGNGNRWTAAMIHSKAVATDIAVSRYRPKVFIAEGRLDNYKLQKRVNWEAQIRAGRSTTYDVDKVGWYQTASKKTIWEKNKLVNLYVPSLGIDDLLITSRVNMSLDSSGELVSLFLQSPDTYRKDPTEKVDLK